MDPRLTNKPHGNGGCTLAILGALPGYKPRAAYHGTLDVFGGDGNIWVSSYRGELPPGTSVAFDRVARQIVVDWPAFQSGASFDLDNLDFEQGDTGWDKGAGWSIMQGQTAPDPNEPGSKWQAMFADFGGESEIMSHASVPATPGKTYTAGVDVQQGATSANGAGAAVRLRFSDKAGNPIAGTPDGNVVKSGSNSEWKTSSLSVVAPANAHDVRLGAAAFRKRGNAPLWVDHLTWNGAFVNTVPPAGTDGQLSIPLQIDLRDSRGCRATWIGAILGVGVYLTSQLYGLLVDGGEDDAPLLAGGDMQDFRAGNVQQSDTDSPLLTGGSVVALALVNAVTHYEYDAPQSDNDSPLLTGGNVTALTMPVVVGYVTYDAPQSDNDSPLLTGGSVTALTMPVVVGYVTYDAPQSDNDSPLLTGGSVTQLSMTKAA